MMAAGANPQFMPVAMQQLGIDENATAAQWANALGALASRLSEIGDQNAALGVQLQATRDQNEALNNQLNTAHGRLTALEAAGIAQPAWKPRDRMNVTEWKSFFALDKFDGDERKFADWEFKLQNFVRPLAGNDV